MPAVPSSVASATAEYRAADLAVFCAGAELSLVHSRDSGAAAFYRSGTVELLTSLRLGAGRERLSPLPEPAGKALSHGNSQT